MEKIGESLPQKYQSYTIIYCGNLPLDLSFSAFDDWNNLWKQSQVFLGKTRRNITQMITIKLRRTAVNAHPYSDSIDIWLLFYVVNKLIKNMIEFLLSSMFRVPCFGCRENVSANQSHRQPYWMTNQLINII